jgi:mRNA-degrading endonuclease RelE of RelBE toxin-antitoxin system
MRRFRVVIPPDVAKGVRSFHPDLKRSVREALDALSSNPRLGTPLKDELTGLHGYRVKRYRIVFEVDSAAKQVRIAGIGPRLTVYDDLIARRRKP